MFLTRDIRILGIGLLTVVASLMPVVTSDARDQAVQSKGRFTVDDANGKNVGEVVDFTFHPFVTPSSLITPVVVLEIDEQLVVLQVMRDRFFGRGELVFEAPDCVGPPMMRVYIESPVSLLPLVAVTNPGSTVYVADPQETPQSLITKSVRYEFWGCVNLDDNASEELMVRAQPLIDLNAVFTPPYSIRDRHGNKERR